MTVRPVSLAHACATLVLLFAVASASAGTPTRGTVYIGNYAGQSIYRVDFSYDGAKSMAIDEIHPVAGGIQVSYGLAFTPKHRLLALDQGTLQLVNPNSGGRTAFSTNNNASTIAVDPDGQTAWAGWGGTPLSSVPLYPMGDGTMRTVIGDDTDVTDIAFTPSNGAFYTTGDPSHLGNVGRIDMTTLTTHRLFAGMEATCIHYDPFSHTVIFAQSGHAAQFDPASPATLLSSRSDNGGDGYMDVAPDGYGHLLSVSTTGSGSWMSLVDYSATGLIGDPTSLHVSVSIPQISFATIVAIDVSLFADDFEP